MAARTELKADITSTSLPEDNLPSMGKSIEELLASLLAMIEYRAVFLAREAVETYAPRLVWGVLAAIVGAICLGNLIFGVVVQGLSLILINYAHLSTDIARLWVLAVLTMVGLASTYAIIRAKLPSRT